MDQKPLVSIVILDVKDHYLLPLTLESILKQDEKSYDITIATRNILPKDLQRLRDYRQEVQFYHFDDDQALSKIRNKMIDEVKGEYIHFLFPGEYYLSKYSLSYAKKKIEEKKYPDIVCFSLIMREVASPPRVYHVSFDLSLLGGEKFPTFAKDILFKKTSAIAVGKFDERYLGLEGFDLVNRIYLKKGTKQLCLRRVIVDYELQKIPPKLMRYFLSDLIMIIYRQYGFFKLLHWRIVKEIFDLLTYWIKSIRRYFVQAE